MKNMPPALRRVKITGAFVLALISIGCAHTRKDCSKIVDPYKRCMCFRAPNNGTAAAAIAMGAFGQGLSGQSGPSQAALIIQQAEARAHQICVAEYWAN